MARWKFNTSAIINKHDVFMKSIYEQMKTNASFSNVRARKQKNLQGDQFIGEISFNFIPKNRRYIFSQNPLDDLTGGTLWDSKQQKIIAEFGSFYPAEKGVKQFPKVKNIRQILEALKEV